MDKDQFAQALEDLLTHVNAGRQPTSQEFTRTVEMRDRLLAAWSQQAGAAEALRARLDSLRRNEPACQEVLQGGCCCADVRKLNRLNTCMSCGARFMSG